MSQASTRNFTGAQAAHNPIGTSPVKDIAWANQDRGVTHVGPRHCIDVRLRQYWSIWLYEGFDQLAPRQLVEFVGDIIADGPETEAGEGGTRLQGVDYVCRCGGRQVAACHPQTANITLHCTVLGVMQTIRRFTIYINLNTTDAT
jgi:hypothetical protein